MMFGKKTPLELARIELEAFEKRAVKLKARHRAKADALLAGGDTSISQAADAITKAAAEVRVLDAGIRGLHEQRGVALATALRRQAKTLRKQTEEKRKEHAGLAARGRKLLDELGRIEGVTFESLPPTARRPRSTALIEEAASAEREAARIETEGLPAAGEARAETLADPLSTVTAQGDCLLYPELAAIEDWARGCEATLKRMAPTLMNAPRTYRLAWRRNHHRQRHGFALGRPALLPPHRRRRSLRARCMNVERHILADAGRPDHQHDVHGRQSRRPLSLVGRGLARSRPRRCRHHPRHPSRSRVDPPRQRHPRSLPLSQRRHRRRLRPRAHDLVRANLYPIHRLADALRARRELAGQEAEQILATA